MLEHEPFIGRSKTTAEIGGDPDQEVGGGKGGMVHEVFKSLAVDSPCLGELDASHRGARFGGIEYVDLADRLAGVDPAEEDIAPVLLVDCVEHPGNDKEERILIVALFNEGLSGVDRQKLAIGTENSAIVLAERFHDPHGGKFWRGEIVAAHLVIGLRSGKRATEDREGVAQAGTLCPREMGRQAAFFCTRHPPQPGEKNRKSW